MLLTPWLLSGQVPTTWQSRGVGAGGALYSPSINPANDNEFYLACDMSDVFHTTDYGNSYSLVSFVQNQGGRFAQVQFTRDPDILYNLDSSGDYVKPVRSVDGGNTWGPLPGNPDPWDDFYSLWGDYANPARLVLGGWNAIYLSTNGGASFVPLNVPITGDTGGNVAGAFFDGSNIYLGASVGLLVSTDGGGSFVNAGTPGIPASEYIRSFAGAKSGSQTRFFCLTVGETYAGQDGGDYWDNIRGIYSLDNGAGVWTRRMAGIDTNSDFLMFLAMARNDINTVYAGGSKYSSSGNVPGVMKTTDAGLSWRNVFLATHNQNILTGWSGDGGDRGWGYGEAVYGLAAAPSNSARVVFTDMGFAHRTADGGATWEQAYVRASDEHPTNTTTIARASYHGIGLENTSCWQIFWSDPTNVFAGFSDIRGIRSTDGGVSWSFNYAGYSANTLYRAAIHPVTHAIYAATSDIHDMYQSTHLADSPLNNADANGKIILSLDKGATWQTVHSFGHPVFWLCLDPNNPNLMYASVVSSTSGGVFACANLQAGLASTWTRLPSPPRTEGHPASIVALNNGKVLCTFSGRRNPGFTASSGLFVYDPKTGLWSDVSDPGMLYWTKDVVVDPSDATQQTWYVGVFSGWGGPPNGLGGLYRTTDGGAHWARINALDRVTSITFNPADANEAYLTTETSGLWRTTNVRAQTPSFSLVSNYPFRQPERVYFNPFDPDEIWITSFGSGLMVGSSAPPAAPSYPPIAEPQSIDLLENGSSAVTLAGHTADNQPMAFSVVAPPVHGVLTGTPPFLTYTPGTNFAGPDHFLFIASAGGANSAPAVVNLCVNYPTNSPPSVTMLSPANHAWFVGPADLVLTASANASDGIKEIDFFSGTNRLGSVTNLPYAFTWTNVPPGAYSLFARAVDNDQSGRYSIPATITVLGARPWLDLRATATNQASIQWPLGVDGWLLQEATNLAGPWSLSSQPVTDTALSHSATLPVAGQRFFRIMLPQ